MANAGGLAIVTGGARGIGRAIAESLGASGLDLLLVDLLAETLEETARALRSSGYRVETMALDVADYPGVQQAGRDLVTRRGAPRVLVNNAGIAQPKTLLEITEEEWDRTMAVHVKGAFNWCKAIAPAMLDAGFGRIVNISSINATTGGSPTAVSRFAYATAKAAILGLTRGLARELGPAICVNAICPGPVVTELTRENIDRRGDALSRAIPLGRVGTPEDIAMVVNFLATAEPCFITGEIVDVDGGQHIN